MTGKYVKYKPEFRDEIAKVIVDSNRSIAEVAREYGLNEATVGSWVKKYRAAHAGEEPPLELSERARLRELEPDRGSQGQYTSTEYRQKLGELGLRHSVGRTGQCWDNALAEAFFASLKNERVHLMVYPTRKKAKADIAQWIEPVRADVGAGQGDIGHSGAQGPVGDQKCVDLLGDAGGGGRAEHATPRVVDFSSR